MIPTNLPALNTISVTLDLSGNLIGSGVNLFSANTGLAFSALSGLGLGGSSTNTGQLTGVFYPLNSNPLSYVVSGATGNFVTKSQTGNFVTNTQTGSFITSGQTGNFVTNFQTGAFVSTGTNGIITSIQTKGFQYSLGGTGIDWTSGTHFVCNLTNNTTFGFFNTLNTMSIELMVFNTGTWTATFPSGTTGVPVGVTGVKWQGGSAPVQTTGSKTDIYSFIQINNTIFGSAIQNF